MKPLDRIRLTKDFDTMFGTTLKAGKPFTFLKYRSDGSVSLRECPIYDIPADIVEPYPLTASEKKKLAWGKKQRKSRSSKKPGL